MHLIEIIWAKKYAACIEVFSAVGRKSLEEAQPLEPRVDGAAPRGRQLARARNSVACG